MRSFAIALMLAAILAGQLALGGHEHSLLLVAPAQVLLGVVAASLLLGELTWLTVIGGAASPLALTWLQGWSPAVAVAAQCGCWLAPRLWLADSRHKLLSLTVVSMGAAALAGLVVARFVWAQPLYHFTACVFAGGSLALATVVIPTDTLVAASLDAAARLLSGKAADALTAAASAHRQSRQLPDRTERTAAQWHALLRLADQRLAMQSASGAEPKARRAQLDDEIVALAESLVHPPAPVVAGSTATPRAGAPSPEVSPGAGATEPRLATAAGAADGPASTSTPSDASPESPPASEQAAPDVESSQTVAPPAVDEPTAAQSPPRPAPPAPADATSTTDPAPQP